MIPTMIPYEKDELLHSWICRLAIHNGFDNLEHFIRSYTSSTFHLSYDTKDIEFLLINLPEWYQENFLDIYLGSSLYPYYSIFLTPEQQTNYLNAVFRRYKKDSKMQNDFSKVTFKEFRFCPVCKQIELDTKGFYFYHREHQLPGVRVCTKHKCKLHKYLGKPNKIFEENIKYEQIQLKTDLETEYKYCLFVEKLLKADLDLNQLDLNQIILNQFKKLHIKNYEEFKQTHLADMGLTPLLSNRKYRNFLNPRGINTDNLFEIDLSVILYALFDKVENIPITSNRQLCFTEREFKDEDYEIVSKHRDNIIELQHKTCGNSYITSGSSFSQGWRCPECDINLPDQKIFKKILYHHVRDEYEMKDNFNGWNSPITMYHKACGQMYKTVPSRFIFNGHRCECESKLSFDKIDKRIKTHKGYELVQINQGNETVRIRSIECGHEFDIVLSNFMRNPFCRVCSPYVITSKKDFIQQVKLLTGDEYEVIGDYHPRYTKKKVKFIHKKCGKEIEMYAGSFLFGQRCPHCTKKVTLEALSEFVEKSTDGKFKCIADHVGSNRLITVLNTETNETINLTKQVILQEIRRPSPSVILPYEKKKKLKTDSFSQSGKYLEQLKEKYKTDDILFSRNMNLNPAERHLLWNLVRENKIKELATGVYSLCNKEYSNVEILEAFYTLKDSEIIGYPIGATFLFKIGYLKKQSDSLFFASKRVKTKLGMQTYRYGIYLTVYPCYYPLLNERALIILPVIDTLKMKGNAKKDELFKYLSDYLKKNQVSLSELEEYLSYYSDANQNLVRYYLKKGGFI